MKIIFFSIKQSRQEVKNEPVLFLNGFWKLDNLSGFFNGYSHRSAFRVFGFRIHFVQLILY
jgi:hypothetical protein